jgi:hypothetical protein
LQEEELENSKKKYSPKETTRQAFRSYNARDRAKPVESEKVKPKIREYMLGSLKTY